MFTLGIDKYEEGVIGNTAIVMGVVEKLSMKSPLLKILGQHHWLEPNLLLSDDMQELVNWQLENDRDN